MDDPKVGDKVKWNAPGGEATGTIKKKLTSDCKIDDHQVRASEDDPQWLVESDNGGKAAHKASALTKA